MERTMTCSRQELHCPHCQLHLVCAIGDGLGGVEERVPGGWPDAPAYCNFYQLILDSPETRQAVVLNSLWCVDTQTSCPGCQQSFTPREAGASEPVETVSQEISWAKAYKALDTQRMSKTEEFQSRMDLWRQSNQRRRSKGSFGETLLIIPSLFYAIMIEGLFSKMHFKWASVCAFLGFSIAFIEGQEWADIGAQSALFACFPATLVLGGLSLISPLMVYGMSLHHFSIFRARRKWAKEGSDFRKNLSALLPMLDETKPMERLVKAEGHRELGQFEEALALIEQGLPEHLGNYSLTLKTLCEQKNDQFIYRDSFKEATDESALAFKTPNN